MESEQLAPSLLWVPTRHQHVTSHDDKGTLPLLILTRNTLHPKDHRRLWHGLLQVYSKRKQCRHPWRMPSMCQVSGKHGFHVVRTMQWWMTVWHRQKCLCLVSLDLMMREMKQRYPIKLLRKGGDSTCGEHACLQVRLQDDAIQNRILYNSLV